MGGTWNYKGGIITTIAETEGGSYKPGSIKGIKHTMGQEALWGYEPEVWTGVCIRDFFTSSLLISCSVRILSLMPKQPLFLQWAFITRIHSCPRLLLGLKRAPERVPLSSRKMDGWCGTDWHREGFSDRSRKGSTKMPEELKETGIPPKDSQTLSQIPTRRWAGTADTIQVHRKIFRI